MSILAEWGDGTTNLIFHIAILLTGLAFEITGFRLVASGFRTPKSTVLFQWGEHKLQMTQVGPGDPSERERVGQWRHSGGRHSGG